MLRLVCLSQGGAVAYAAAVASAYGVRACIVTAAGPDAELAVFKGHELHVVPTDHTLTFEHSYTWWGELSLPTPLSSLACPAQATLHYYYPAGAVQSPASYASRFKHADTVESAQRRVVVKIGSSRKRWPGCELRKHYPTGNKRKLRVTASAHRRLLVMEVAGKAVARRRAEWKTVLQATRGS